MNPFVSPGSSIFVGREAEVAVLTLLLNAAAQGHGSVALIAGEPGIGKTRLMEELSAVASGSGVQVLWGRCYEGDGAPALWPWVQMLRAYAGSRTPSAVRGELGTRASEVVALVPELNTLIPELPAPQPVAAAQERFRLFDTITAWLKVSAADQPLMLLLDDLHWADTSSLLLLDFLAQELTASRLFVVGAYRDMDVRRGQPLLAMLGGLVRRPHVARIVLSGLGVDDLARYIELSTGAPAPTNAAATLMTETEGNPLYVTQMALLVAVESASGGARGARVPVPPTLREVIGRQFERLSGPCVATLSVAAVVGREFHLAIVASASELPRDSVLDALEEAEAAGVIQQAIGIPGLYRFSHALIRETLYEELPTIRRARLHLQVAESIEAVYGLQSTAHTAELATHFRLAIPVGGAGKAVAYARQAGDAAAAVFAWEEAIGQWQTAVDLAAPDDWDTRSALLVALGEAQNHVGERDQAKATFLKAAEAAAQLRRSAAGRASGIRYLARAALNYGGPGVALGALDQRQVDLLVEALAATGGRQPHGDARLSRSPDDPDQDWRALSAQLLARLALTLFWTSRREESLALTRDAVTMARLSGDPRALIAALDGRRYVLWSPEFLQERAGFAAEMLELVQALGDPELTLQALRWRIVDSLELGDMGAVDGAIERYTQLAEELRLPFYCWYARLFVATRALSMGEFADGERLASEALAFGERAGDPDAAMFFTMQLLPTRIHQGRAAELEADVRGLVERYPGLLAYRCRLAAVCAELGQMTEARAAFEDVARRTADASMREFAGLARDGNWLITMVNLARACHLLEDRARAATIYVLLEPYADRTVVAGAGIASVGPVSYWLGGLAALLGRTRVAAMHYEATLAMATRTQAIPLLALTQHAYAELLLSSEPHTQQTQGRAVDLLKAALATAEALGMAPLERAIRALLVGKAVDRPELTRRHGTARFPDGLSAREVELLQLLAGGRSNREIAEDLVLSVNTVQSHLRNIFTKIDVRSRAEATAYVFRHGLASPEPPAP